MTYTAEQVDKLLTELATVTGKHHALLRSYVNWPFQNEEAKRYAHHGFLRRMKTLARSAARTFELLPPAQRALPEAETVHDAEINIQAFVFNTFGAIDNLAWVLIKERGLKTVNGKEIPENKVGLRKGNHEVRGAVSSELRDYLVTLDPWFNHLEEFRHALAHRVPLYIPPYSVDPANAARYQELEQQRVTALFTGRVEGHEALTTEQDRLKFFKALMLHSVDSRGVAFHAQILADFNTVDELGKKVLEELTRPRGVVAGNPIAAASPVNAR